MSAAQGTAKSCILLFDFSHPGPGPFPVKGPLRGPALQRFTDAHAEGEAAVSALRTTHAVRDRDELAPRVRDTLQVL